MGANATRRAVWMAIIISTLCSLAILGFSFSQVSSRDHAEDGSFTLTYTNPLTDKKESACKRIQTKDGKEKMDVKNPFYDNAPFRAKAKTSEDWVYCTWHSTNIVVRLVTCVLALIVSFFGLRGLAKRKKMFYRLWTLSSFLLFAAFLYAMSIDAMAVSKGNNFLGDCLPDVKKPAGGGTWCDVLDKGNHPFVLMVLVDAAAVVVYFITFVLSFRYQRKYMSEDFKKRGLLHQTKQQSAKTDYSPVEDTSAI